MHIFPVTALQGWTISLFNTMNDISYKKVQRSKNMAGRMESELRAHAKYFVLDW